jgi:hypothetical protein
MKNNIQLLGSDAPPPDAPCLASIVLHEVGVEGYITIRCDELAHTGGDHLAKLEYHNGDVTVEIRWTNKAKETGSCKAEDKHHGKEA